ncbi:unnamed protein product [Prorocentrum cordatum]|uniref:Uncharacterized protein n=1 Tax=Prorocentrum cordatum TaxID=2364126 RepID=A0ABN9WHB8_9DINO|nr:unnamed protein product [Polarella glacialis]
MEIGAMIDRYLEPSTATPRAPAQCHRVLEHVGGRRGRQDLFELPSETMGACPAHYFASLRLQGERAPTGMHVAAAVNHFYLKYGRLGAGSPPRMWKAIKGWKKLTPGRARVPEPLVI